MSSTGLKHHLWLYYSLSSTNSFLVVQAGHSGPQVLRKMNTSLPCSLVLSRQLLNLSVLSCISPTLWMPAPLRQAASSHSTCWAGHRSLTHICFVPIRFPAPCATPQTAFCSQLRFVQLISMHFFSPAQCLQSFKKLFWGAYKAFCSPRSNDTLQQKNPNTKSKHSVHWTKQVFPKITF